MVPGSSANLTRVSGNSRRDADGTSGNRQLQKNQDHTTLHDSAFGGVVEHKNVIEMGLEHSDECLVIFVRDINLVLAIVLPGAAYIGLLFLLRTVTREDLDVIKGALSRRKKKRADSDG